MKLGTLLNDYFDISDEDKNINVSGICTDTRELKDGDLFILQKGFHFDSHDVYEELEDKAVAFISEKEIKASIPYFIVQDANDFIGPIAAKFFDNPTEKLTNIAITGTNGKTSVASIISHILQSHHRNVGIVGTNGVFINNNPLMENIKTPTTPPPLDTQKIAYELVKNAADYNVMEVTSHGLYFDRTKGIDYTYRIFTNLSEDHLDFHGTMEDYFSEKMKLFQESKEDQYCILNIDIPHYTKLSSLGKGTVVSYGIDKKADFRASNIETSGKYISFDVTYKGETVRIDSSLIGRFNIYNILSAIAVARLEGISLTDIKRYMKTFEGIDGRMEKEIIDGKIIVVDFAHTPDALENVLYTLSLVKKNKLITVFGCGGDRDKTKRPLMGEIASKYSDEIFVTSDNPRTEDPSNIINDITKGIYKTYHPILDRKKAITSALDIAEVDDIVLIAGKGNEKTQIIGTKEYEFDDLSVTKNYLNLKNQ